MGQNEVLAGLCKAVMDGKRELAETWAKKALDEGLDPLLAIEKGITRGLVAVGDAFHRGERFLPELVMAAEAAMASTGILQEGLGKTISQTQTSGVIVIGTVAGDVHDIGKNLVATLFRGSGFSVIDLGVNVPADRFIEAVKAYKPNILGLSALLTTTVKEQKVVIDSLNEESLRSRVRVMVGGAAVTPEWADAIGADAYAEDAGEAIERGKEFLGLH